MHIYFSDLGKSFYAHDREIDVIRGLCIDLETGRFLAVRGKLQCYPLEDCLWKEGGLTKVGNRPDRDEFCTGKKILGMAVVTEEKEKLGTVRDFAFDSDLFSLTHIVLDKMFFGIHWGKRIIPRQQIVEIRAKTIIVRQNEERKRSVLKRPAIEISPA